MIKVAICDDEKKDCHEIREYLEKYGKKYDIELHIEEYNKGEDLIKGCVEPYDVLFLDIELGGMDGLETAKKIREKNAITSIVFVTNYDQYAIKGYQVDASGYVVKPLGRQNIEEVISKAIQRMKERSSHITIHYKGKERVCSIGNILYVEVNGHKLTYHFLDGDQMRGVGTLDSVINQDKESYFIRIHKSYLINKMWVERYETKDHKVYMKGKKTGIKVSRYRWNEFITKYLTYCGESLC